MINMLHFMAGAGIQDLGPSGPLHNNVDTMNTPYIIAADTTIQSAYDEVSTDGNTPYIIAVGP